MTTESSSKKEELFGTQSTYKIPGTQSTYKIRKTFGDKQYEIGIRIPRDKSEMIKNEMIKDSDFTLSKPAEFHVSGGQPVTIDNDRLTLKQKYKYSFSTPTLRAPILKSSTPTMSQKEIRDHGLNCISCKLCGLDNVYENGSNAPLRCKRCNSGIGEENLIPVLDDIENPSSDAYRQYRWTCYSCGHKGLKWMERNKVFSKCPVCENDTSDFSRSEVDQRGKCKSIWASHRFEPPQEPPPKLPWKSLFCSECGSKQRYLVRIPNKCGNCGRTLKKPES